MNYIIKAEKHFKYIETGGEGPVLMLLHGLFGALSNFQGIINHFGDKYNVVVPMLPILELPIIEVSVGRLVQHVEEFVFYKNFKGVNLVGNSLGGHITILYALQQQERVNTITLTGSSGLFESAMGSSFPRRGDFDYIKKKTEDTFYNPKTATEELINEVFDIVNDRGKAIRVVATSKSAVRQNLSDKLHLIKCPTLLIWGKQDNVTPPFVGEKFHELIPHSELFFVNECGHAPMMEKPDEFNSIMETFLKKHQ